MTDTNQATAKSASCIEPQPAAPPSGSTPLPFSRWLPVICGAALGLVYRLGAGVHLIHVMTGTFLFGVPLLVGAATVLLAERRERRSLSYYAFAPMLSVLLFVAGTAAIMIEGSICIAMALPIFLVLGSLGGLAAGIACRLVARARHSLPALAILPLLLAHAESRIEVHDHVGCVVASIDVAAAPAIVWAQLSDVQNIAADEVGEAWIYRIGVPRPVAGRTIAPGPGGVRVSQWEKNVHFRERITQWEPQRLVRWTYEFEPDSFPAGALDEHVRIGGEYFDLRNTSYRLEPRGDGTRLTIRTEYRVSTGFNWYSDTIAQAVLNDFSHTILTMYRQRAERAAGPT